MLINYQNKKFLEKDKTMKKLLPTILFILFSSFLYAQSADVITEILNTDQVTFGQVCYLSAVQQGFIEDDASYSDAINALYEKKQIPMVQYEDTIVPLVNLSFIYTQMWNVKGGLMYRIFHGAPRYAFKQLKADGILSVNANPNSLISGKDALNIYTECSIKYGNMELSVE